MAKPEHRYDKPIAIASSESLLQLEEVAGPAPALGARPPAARETAVSPAAPAKHRAKPIRDRAAIIGRRGCLGDLVLGLPGSGGLLTLVDRRSRFLCLELVQNKTSRHVHERAKQALSKLPGTQRHSHTFDNGREFARCPLVEKSHNTRLYFAVPTFGGCL